MLVCTRGVVPLPFAPQVVRWQCSGGHLPCCRVQRPGQAQLPVSFHDFFQPMNMISGQYPCTCTCTLCPNQAGIGSNMHLPMLPCFSAQSTQLTFSCCPLLPSSLPLSSLPAPQHRGQQPEADRFPPIQLPPAGVQHGLCRGVHPHNRHPSPTRPRQLRSGRRHTLHRLRAPVAHQGHQLGGFRGQLCSKP